MIGEIYLACVFSILQLWGGGGALCSPYVAEIKEEVIKKKVMFLIKSFSPGDSGELVLSFLGDSVNTFGSACIWG